MYTNWDLAEQATARHCALLEEAAHARLLAELTRDRQPWPRHAARNLWAWLRGWARWKGSAQREAQLTTES